MVWETKAGPGAPTKYFFHGDPFIGSDLIVVGADVGGAKGVTGHIHAFDKTTGQSRWTLPVGAGAAAAIVGTRGRIFVPTFPGELLAVEQQSGQIAWRVPFKPWAWEGPALAGDRVYAGGADGTLYSFRTDSGSIVWKVSLGSPITTSVSVRGDDLYVATQDGTLHRVNRENGAVRATLKIDASLRPRGTPVWAGDSLLLLLADEREDSRAIVSVKPSLERVEWRRTAPDRWSTTRLFIWGNSVVVGTSSGDVQGYCTSDGSPAWSHTVKGTVRAIGGADDTLYVGTPQGSLYALKVSSTCQAKRAA